MIKKLGQFSLGPIIGAILSFIIIPIITLFISPEEYGKASMFSVCLSILQMVLYLGQDQAYVKKYYEIEDKPRLLTNAVSGSLLALVFLEVVILFFRKRISVFLFDSEEYIHCVYAMMIILPAYVVEQFALVNVRMNQQGMKYSALTVGLKLVTLCTTVLLLALWERSFQAVVWGTVLADVFLALLLICMEGKRLKVSPSLFDPALAKQLLCYGLPLVPASIISWVLSGMDKVMLRFMCDYSVLGIYSIAAKVMSVLSIVQSCFTLFWIPVAHQWNKENVEKGMFVKVGRIVTLIMSIVFLGILLVKELVFLIFPAEYKEAAYIFPFLLLQPIMYSISEVTVMGIYFKEKTSFSLGISAVAAASNLILNWFLIPVWGAVGAAVATGLSYLVFFWLRTLISRRIWFDFPLGTYGVITVVLVAACAVNTFAAGWMVYVFNAVALLGMLVYFRKDIEDIICYILKNWKKRSE